MCQSVQPFDSFQELLNLWHPNPPPPHAPWAIEGRLVFSLCPFPDESADVNQSWCQSESFPILLNCWPPKTPQVPPCVSRGNLFGVYPFQYEFAHVCQIWCQSAQPFGSFSRICAKVSSAFRRCTRWLAQKHVKKQHLYIENYNSGPNMQTSTSLTLFTAIFVTFSGALVNDILPEFHGVAHQLDSRISVALDNILCFGIMSYGSTFPPDFRLTVQISYYTVCDSASFIWRALSAVQLHWLSSKRHVGVSIGVLRTVD